MNIMEATLITAIECASGRPYGHVTDEQRRVAQEAWEDARIANLNAWLLERRVGTRTTSAWVEEVSIFDIDF